MKVRFCGVRGSTPAPGADFVRTGGHTSCVAVYHDDEPVPRLLLDAGTGIRAVTPLLGGDAFRGTIVLTHLHWDHVQGLPFFGGGDRDEAVVRLLLPAPLDGTSAFDVLSRAMSPPHFPIDAAGLRGTWSVESLEVGAVELEGFTVVAGEVPHKGGRTYGLRVADDHSSIAYVPDHLPAAGGPERDAVVSLIRGVDALIHDAQFVDAESALATAYGHATIDEAVELADDAQVRELVLFHHSPARTDDQLDDVVADIEAGNAIITVAREGDELVV